MRRLLSAVFVLSFFQLLQAQPCREVIAYFPSWKWYHRNQLVNPASIDYSKYTIINYAFFQPNWDGSISPFDPAADKKLLLGDAQSFALAGGKENWSEPPGRLADVSLVDRAHEHGVRVVISVGGWTLSQQFSAIAADEIKRRRFAESCKELIETYNVDGIDLDWEYPGYAGNKGSPDDRENFTHLLEGVRDVLDELTRQTGKPLLLTAAFGVSPHLMAQIEWHKVRLLLDYVNLMTYDFYSRDHPQTNHHAPLFAPAKGLTGFDLNSVVQHLTERYGVPPEKINIGLAFYGKSFKTAGSPGLHVASRRTMDVQTFPEDAGSPMFYNILSRKNLFNYRWDSLAQAPYLQGKNSLNTFVTFEDEHSVAQKARYIVEKNLAGAIIWDLTGDYIEGSPGVVAATPLATALSEALCRRTAEGVSVPEPLPMLTTLVKQRPFAPRLAWSGEAPAKNKQQKKEKKRRKKQEEVPVQHFDARW